MECTEKRAKVKAAGPAAAMKCRFDASDCMHGKELACDNWLSIVVFKI